MLTRTSLLIGFQSCSLIKLSFVYCREGIKLKKGIDSNSWIV